MSKKPLSPELVRELEKVESLPDSEIDTAAIPETSPENWRHARRGELYRPLKHAVTIRLDADVLAWFKEHAGGRRYQTEINRVLRRHVADADKSNA